MAKKKKKKYSPDFLASMQEVFDNASGKAWQEEQVKRQDAVTQGHHNELQGAWEQTESCVVAYLKGESSRPMVNAITDLTSLVESAEFSARLRQLADPVSLPRLAAERDRAEVAVCQLVIGTWAAMRIDGVDPEELISALDDNAARIPLHHVGFVKHVIERGGLTNCVKCGQRLGPSSLQRGRCGDCIAARKNTLEWLGVAIECNHNHDNRVYAGGVEAHFPCWNQWKFRLEEHFGHTQCSEVELWKKWIGYVCEHRGIDKSHFLETPLTEAETLLPPVPADILLAREQHNDEAEQIQQSSLSTAKPVVAPVTQPEEMDDDLWFQLDTCIRAMETVNGGAYGLIHSWKIGTESDSKYLQNINQLAIEAGWEPFVFPRGDGLEVVRTNGEIAFCHHHRGSYSSDEVGGDKVLSSLRAWRARRAAELRAMKESLARSGTSNLQADNRMLSDLALSIDRLVEFVSKPKGKRRKATQENDHQDWEKVFREYDAFAATKVFQSKVKGSWTVRFEEFWSNRSDLQVFAIDAAWRRIEAARKRIERRSR